MYEFGKEWPEGVSFQEMHLWCYLNWDPFNPNMLPKHVHFTEAIKLLWPEKLPNGKEGFIWSDWAHRIVQAWCDHKFLAIWGPSSSGKSTVIGVCALTEWLAHPVGTTISVCSTGLDYLRRRIWREILRHYTMHGKDAFPGDHFRQPPRIVYNTEEASSTIDGIFGTAVPRGENASEAGGMIGVHNKYSNIMVVDEGQATDGSVLTVWDNLSTGRSSKFCIMGNPVSRVGPLEKASEPIGGWGSINTSMEEWPTKRGICLYLDGLKSPAIKNPEKYYFLLKQKDIDDLMVDPGPDSPRFWTQRRGFLPPEGLTETIITETFANQFKICERATWAAKYKMYAALDPSFSSGGDKAVFCTFRIGAMTDGNIGIEFDVHHNVQHAMSADKTVTYAMADEVMGLLDQFDIPLENFGIDVTSSQRVLADVLEKEWNEKHKKKNPNHVYQSLLRVDFSGGASDRLLSPTDPRLAKTLYANKVTELYFQFRAYCENYHIRGVWNDAVSQMINRELLPRPVRSGKQQIETKNIYKERTGGKSPDDSDAVVIATEVARMIGGIEPEQQKMFGSTENPMEFLARESDIDALDSNYSEEYIPGQFDSVM